MEFRILGELEVEEGGRAVVLGGARQRALLTNLLLHPGEVVSVDRLIDDLYGAHPPATAAKSLQAHISRLRKTLGGEQRLRTRGGGYVLELSPGELDVERFSTLLEEGRRSLAAGNEEVAVATLELALTLWRGRPLADVAYAEFAQGEVARLDELHLAAVEELVDARIALGRHGEVVGELERLVVTHPLRERLRASLLLALYRSGRQAEALDVYQRARSVLVEELGIEPTRALRELHQAILNQDPALDLPVTDVPDRAAGPAASVPLPVVDAVIHDVRKIVTALFVRLAVTAEGGATLDPEALRRVTGRAFETLEAAAGRHGGTIEAVSGDAITAVFGLPLVHEDDALRAVRAATDARADLFELAAALADERALRLDFRIGVSTGEVVTGGGAVAQARATGEPLTIAARLGDRAALGEILIDTASREVLRGAVVAEPAGSDWRIRDIAEVARGRVSRFDSPMVGRDRERRRLRGAFDQAVSDRSCQLFTVLGAAGVGKSRLVQELLEELAGQAVIARGRCLSYGEGITYWPVIEAIKEAASLDETEAVEQSLERLATLLEGVEDADLAARRVAEVVGLVERGTGVEDGFWAIRTFFEALARRRPLVLVFDDIHWGEQTFLELIEHIADWTREVPITLICIARPELLEVRPGWGGGKVNATVALLEPLSDDESSQLIDNLAGTSLEEKTRRRVIEAAEGNALFVEEMLALALEDGEVNGELKVPPTIQALLAARLDRLAEDERAVLERASVEGNVFHQGWTTELSPVTLRPLVATNLAALARKELIRPDRALFSGEHGFRFRHLLIRDAAYEAIPKETRADLHERHALWLEEKLGARIVEYEEIIGYHLERAFRYRLEIGAVDETTRRLARRAAEHLGAAGRRAFARSDAPAAVNLISRAAALLPTDDPARVELVPNVRVVQGLGSDLAWADRILTEALGGGDDRLKAHALVQRGFLRLFTDPEVDPVELIEVAEEAMAVFEPLEDELGLARAWRLVAQAHYLAKKGSACAEASENALVHARRVGDSFELKEIVEWLVVALTLGPAPADEAHRRCVELLAMVAGDSPLEVTLHSMCAYLEAMQGRMTEAKHHLGEARRVAQDLGALYRVAYFSIYAGLVELLAADSIAAERELTAGRQSLAEVGEQTNYTTVNALLARALAAQHRYPETIEYTKASEAAARPNDVFANITWRSVRAYALAHQDGRQQEALSLGREAVTVAAQSDFYNAHGDALVELAEILQLAGRAKDAADALDEALRLYDAKRNIVSAANARTLLQASDSDSS
jgi:DNA-binding SARP family transcriptional activator/class 3 adenylate cyclase